VFAHPAGHLAPGRGDRGAPGNARLIGYGA